MSRETKMSIMGHPHNPLGLWGMVKLSYIYDNIRWGEVNLRLSKLTLAIHYLPSVGPKQLCALAVTS